MPFFLFLFIALGWSSDEEWIKEHPKWLKLLHYEKNLIGSWKSRADGKSFFYSNSRKPKDEFEAYLAAVKKPQSSFEKPDLHPGCMYPLRTKYLIKRGYLKEPVKLYCPALSNYKKEMNAEKISLVFSSYYIENPSSAFGHTFLRIHQPIETKKVDLLDTGIGYAATPTTSNPFLYTIYGFSGGFPGEFRKVPFYYKVREYNDFETRDLWTYHLDLNKQEVEDMVDHLWEVSHTHFPYYYLTENCSFFLVDILEMVAPRYDILNQIPFWIIPIDTVKATLEAGAVTKIDFRPSAFRVFNERFRDLSKKDQELFYEVLEKKDWELLRTNAKSLDALSDYLDVRYFEELQDKASYWSEAKHKINLYRAGLNKKTKTIKIKPKDWEKPHNIFPLQRFGFSFGNSKIKDSYLGLEQRFANHDFLDPLAGKPPFSKIEFFKIRAKFYESEVLLDHFSIVALEAMPATTRLFPRISWGVDFGFHQYTSICSSCISPFIEGGGGFSWELMKNKFHVSTLLWLEFFTENRLEKGYSARLGPYLQMAYYPIKDLRFQIRYKPSWEVRDLNQNYDRINLEARYDIKKRSSLGLEYSKRYLEERSQISYYYYY